MEEALSELFEETAALHAEHSAALVGATASEMAEQPVREHLEALAEQAERYLEALAEAAGEADTRSLTEAELESVFESVPPLAGVAESPAFEQFFGALKNFAKKAVSGAVNLAKKGVQAVKTGVKAVAKVMPIGLILRQLRPIVQPLLMRVLKIAIGRLPAPVRPIATQLARKLLREAPMTEAEETEEAASADRAPAAEALGAEPAPAALLSLELAGATAGLLLTGDESEREAWAAEAEALAEARERFTEALGRLPDGGDPRPALEEFLPVVMAALPIVRKIVQIAGRQNVVGALSNLLAALIGKFTGPRNARILADAIADTGLKLLSTETAAEAPERLAASALAATAEDTVRQLAQLPAEELEDRCGSRSPRARRSMSPPRRTSPPPSCARTWRRPRPPGSRACGCRCRAAPGERCATRSTRASSRWRSAPSRPPRCAPAAGHRWPRCCGTSSGCAPSRCG